MFKINLPNPREMDATEFFAQMKIALKSAEKSYEEMTKGVELTENNTPWISYRLPFIDKVSKDFSDPLDADRLENAYLEDDAQEVCLVIDRL